jgi:hypothetical protein
MPSTPKLVPLAYGEPYCELCKDPITNLVAWWPVPARGGGIRLTAYCEICHHSNLRHGKALR